MDGDMGKKASHFWAMLDEMAESDPAAYETFIKKTMAEGKEKMALPKPFVCLRAAQLKPTRCVLYVNMCSWEHIPKPVTDADPISVAGGPIEEITDTGGSYLVVRLAFNPYVLEESFKNDVDKDLLINLGMDYIENLHSVKIVRTYKVLKDLKFKGNVESLGSSKRFFGKREKSEEETLREQLAGLSPEALIGQIHDQCGSDFSREEIESRLTDLTLGPSGSGTAKKKNGLIEEIQSTTVELPAPKYELNMQGGDGNVERRLELRLELDGVRSVADCELDISEDELNLYVEGKYRLGLPLPERILESEAKAKFNKKTSVLVVTLPTHSKTADS